MYKTLIKSAVEIASSVGVSKVVHDVIKNNTTIATKFDAVKVWTGALVIGSMVAEQASNHVEGRIEKFTTWYENREVSVKLVKK